MTTKDELCLKVKAMGVGRISDVSGNIVGSGNLSSNVNDLHQERFSKVD